MPDCGCRIEPKEGWTQLQDLRIIYCSLHAAAEQMREALEEIDEACTPPGTINTTWLRNHVKDALTAARGGEK